MIITLVELLLAASLTQGTAQKCVQPVVENAEAKAAIYQRTRIIYARPDTPGVPDNDPDTLHFVVMDASDERSSHVTDDGQVVYLRPEAIDEPCRVTLFELLDQSHEIRLQQKADEG